MEVWKNGRLGNASRKVEPGISKDHKEKLEKTLKNILSGKTGFKKWNDIKKKFRSLE